MAKRSATGFIGAALALSLLGLASISSVSAAPRTPATQPLFSVSGDPGMITKVANPWISQSGMQSANTKTGWFRITSPAAFQGMTQTQYYEVKGKKTSQGAYQYHLEVYLAPGAKAESTVVAVNPVQHTKVFAIGLQPQTVIQPFTTTSSANLATVLYDPFGVQLVQIFDYLTWTWNGTSVTGSSARFPSTILFPDGWFTISESHDSNHGSGGAYALTYGAYANSLFCQLIGHPAAPATIADFNPTQVEGLYNGSRYYNATVTTSGGCADFLSWGAHYN